MWFYKESQAKVEHLWVNRFQMNTKTRSCRFKSFNQPSKNLQKLPSSIVLFKFYWARDAIALLRNVKKVQTKLPKRKMCEHVLHRASLFQRLEVESYPLESIAWAYPEMCTVIHVQLMFFCVKDGQKIWWSSDLVFCLCLSTNCIFIWVTASSKKRIAALVL